jgi:hypothetical protein
MRLVGRMQANVRETFFPGHWNRSTLADISGLIGVWNSKRALLCSPFRQADFTSKWLALISKPAVTERQSISFSFTTAEFEALETLEEDVSKGASNADLWRDPFGTAEHQRNPQSSFRKASEFDVSK